MRGQVGTRNEQDVALLGGQGIYSSSLLPWPQEHNCGAPPHSHPEMKMKVQCLCTAQGFCTPPDELSPNYAWGLCTGILQEFFPAYTGAKIPGANIPIHLGMCNFNASCT